MYDFHAKFVLTHRIIITEFHERNCTDSDTEGAKSSRPRFIFKDYFYPPLSPGV